MADDAQAAAAVTSAGAVWSSLQIVPAVTSPAHDARDRLVERRSVERRAQDALTDTIFAGLPRAVLGTGMLGITYAISLPELAIATGLSEFDPATLLTFGWWVSGAIGLLLVALTALGLSFKHARTQLARHVVLLRYKRHWRYALCGAMSVAVLLPCVLGLSGWSLSLEISNEVSRHVLVAWSLAQVSQLVLLLATLPLLAPLLTLAALGLMIPAGCWLLVASAGGTGAAMLLGMLVLVGLLEPRRTAARWLNIERERLVSQDRVDALTAERDSAQRSIDDKSRFVAAASHDLRQPMHALGLFVATLERRLSGTHEEPLVRTMMHSIELLDRSFGSMLDLSRLDAGNVRPNKQNFPLRDLFRRLHMQHVSRAEANGISLRFAPGGKSVTSDPQLLERILGNLIQNGLRYTREGGVVVLARHRADRLNIEVWDSGCGIQREDLSRVFDEFYRGDASLQAGNSESAHGMGMGLAIVRRLVALLGHTLEVQSTPGRGSLFRIGIMHSALTDIEEQTAAADTRPALAFSASNVLVIDDEPAIREGLQLVLQTWGFTATTAGDVRQACQLATLLGEELDLIISDLHLLRGEDGLQAIAAVREACGREVPAMLITGDTSPAEIRRAAASGHMVLFKPLQPSKLFAMLRNLAD